MKILIVDTPDPQGLLQEAFDRFQALKISYFQDVHSTILHLKSFVAEGTMLPDAILIPVDKHPLESFEILKTIKLTPILSTIAVIMYSSTSSSEYRCYSLGADGYFCSMQSQEEKLEFVNYVVSLVADKAPVPRQTGI